MRIVALSDTHAEHRDVTVPDGNVLVFAGDLMTCGRRFAEVQSFGQWFSNQPHKRKILVAGNHDRLFQGMVQNCLREFHGVDYLLDNGVEIDGVKFWGSPWQPWFYNWAFNLQRGPEIAAKWEKIPKDTDVLITHGPPYGILDQMVTGKYATDHLGCEELRKVIDRINPKVHIFGHIHGSYGRELRFFEENCTDTRFYNVAICDEQYNPANESTVIDL